MLAEDAGDYSWPGFYLGGGGLYGIEDFDTSVEVDNEFGFNFRLGYRLTPNIAIEGMGERVNAFSLTNAVALNVDTWVGTLNGKFFFLTNRIQPYLLAGLGIMRAHSYLRSGFSNVDSSDTGRPFGGVVEWTPISPNIGSSMLRCQV